MKKYFSSISIFTFEPKLHAKVFCFAMKVHSSNHQVRCGPNPDEKIVWQNHRKPSRIHPRSGLEHWAILCRDPRGNPIPRNVRSRVHSIRLYPKDFEVWLDGYHLKNKIQNESEFLRQLQNRKTRLKNFKLYNCEYNWAKSQKVQNWIKLKKKWTKLTKLTKLNNK